VVGNFIKEKGSLKLPLNSSFYFFYLFQGGNLDVSTALAIGVISGTIIGILESKTAIDNRLRLALIS